MGLLNFLKVKPYKLDSFSIEEIGCAWGYLTVFMEDNDREILSIRDNVANRALDRHGVETVVAYLDRALRWRGGDFSDEERELVERTRDKFDQLLRAD